MAGMLRNTENMNLFSLVSMFKVLPQPRALLLVIQRKIELFESIKFGSL